MDLQQWIFPLRFFRENLRLGDGGEEGRDNDIARQTCAPVLFGFGTRLFEGVDASRVTLAQVSAEPTQRVTHLTYAVRPRSS